MKFWYFDYFPFFIGLYTSWKLAPFRVVSWDWYFYRYYTLPINPIDWTFVLTSFAFSNLLYPIKSYAFFTVSLPYYWLYFSPPFRCFGT